MSDLSQFSIQLKYKRRSRRAVMRVKPGQVLSVSVPYGVARSDIESWIKSKANWILEKHKLLEAANKKSELSFSEGSQLPFLGKNLTIKFSGLSLFVTKINNELHLPRTISDPEDSRAIIIDWYRQQTAEFALERSQHYCKILSVQPKSLSIKNYKSRWGACSSKGDLIFNWQIILFSREMFDYVVAHEVCHLKEMNHSPRFYALLKQLGFERRKIHAQFKNLRNIF